MKTKHKIYAFINGGALDCLAPIAVAEDGEVLAGHLSSSETWAKHDIGLTSDWKHEKYDAKYGPEGWELEWVDNPKSHPGVLEASRLNQIAYAKQETEDD